MGEARKTVPLYGLFEPLGGSGLVVLSFGPKAVNVSQHNQPIGISRYGGGHVIVVVTVGAVFADLFAHPHADYGGTMNLVLVHLP